MVLEVSGYLIQLFFFFLLEVKMKGEVWQSLKAAKIKPIPQNLSY